ncbi:hypothetical protein [uncultured Roseivirga sp.]|uniref:hypothetical protein n=1 Tax=uncultured Roseivirga sp. TaxID=543088 RepID=UPI0025862E44|nr:hypothetical protein [uncultured Roseivirga sp.]
MIEFNWEKKGMIFDPTNRFDWMQNYAQVPTVLERPDSYRVYFACRPNPDERGLYVSHIAYADFDKYDLTKLLSVSKKPVLPLGDKGTFDEFGIHPTGILKRGQEIYLYYTGWSRGGSVPYETWIGLAISRDGGETFSRYSEGPILGKSVNDPYLANGAIVYQQEERVHMIYASARKWIRINKKFEPVYTLKSAESTDGILWSVNADAVLPNLNEDECISRPAIYLVEDNSYLWYGYRRASDFHGGENSYRLGFAIKRGNMPYTRLDHLGVPLSSKGWDSEMMSYPAVFKRDNELVMLYNGNAFGKEGFGYCQTLLK